MPERVVICGAGVIGGAIAYYLAKRGTIATIIESDAVAAGASGAAAGWLPSPPPSTTANTTYQLQRLGIDMHQEMARKLPAESGVDYGFRLLPSLLLAVTAAEEAAARERVQSLADAGRDGRWVDQGELLALTGWVSGGNARGAAVLEPSVALDAYRYSLALVTAAERMGVVVQSGTVRGLLQEDGRVTGVEVGRRAIEADTVVIAMGPWSGDAAPWLRTAVPVGPLKGQIVKVRPRRPLPLYNFNRGGNYVLTKAPDSVFLGTTEEHVGFDRGITTEARDEILEFAVGFAPELADAELVEQTACLRPLSADGLPIMGAVPQLAGAYVATGHGRSGIMQSLPSGLAMSELILDGSSHSVDLGPFDPVRFAAD